MKKKIATPLTIEKVKDLVAGDVVLLSGIIYTGRDAAHKKMVETLANHESLPFDPMDQIIYYVGPSPTKPGEVIGSCGPTTSYRMDAYSPTLLEKGLRGMIGKGMRNNEVVQAMKNNFGVYFGANGGCAALLAKCVKSCEVIAYPELGAEAVHRLEVEDFPVIVVIDFQGNNLYEAGRHEFEKKGSVESV